MKSTKRRNWSREETILAFRLYCTTPFGKISSHNKDIIEIAELIGRTPDAVALKMHNLASFDPSLLERGVTAMPHSSKLDKMIWDEFSEDWEGLTYIADSILLKLKNSVVEDLQFPYDYPLPEGTDIESVVKVRRGQQFFRDAVLSAYSNKCCITGLGKQELLVASHIKPWSISNPKTERANPRNGLCLNPLHDKAFDRGFMTIDKDYRIIMSDKLQATDMDENTKDWLKYYNHEKIILPKQFLPDRQFIEYHNDVIFLG